MLRMQLENAQLQVKTLTETIATLQETIRQNAIQAQEPNQQLRELKDMMRQQQPQPDPSGKGRQQPQQHQEQPGQTPPG